MFTRISLQIHDSPSENILLSEENWKNGFDSKTHGCDEPHPKLQKSIIIQVEYNTP